MEHEKAWGVEDQVLLNVHPAGFNPCIQLLGVSTVAGNQTVEKTTQNALDVLDAAGLLPGIGAAFIVRVQ